MKLKKLLENNKKLLQGEALENAKKSFFESMRQFSSNTKNVYRTDKLKEIASKINKISEIAEQITLSETDDWFDNVSVKRDIKHIKESAQLFNKTVSEINTLQQRLESLYEEFGQRLNKYYDIGTINEQNNIVNNEKEFREYAKNILKKAHGDKYDENTANKMIDDLAKKYGVDGKWGDAVGVLQASLNESILKKDIMKKDIWIETPEFGEAESLLIKKKIDYYLDGPIFYFKNEDDKKKAFKIMNNAELIIY